jgi:hypothetical protein
MFKNIWEWWKKVAKKIGDFNSRLILTVFYFIFITPISIPVKLKDPLGIKNKKQSWLPKQTSECTPMEQALRQS